MEDSLIFTQWDVAKCNCPCRPMGGKASQVGRSEYQSLKPWVECEVGLHGRRKFQRAPTEVGYHQGNASGTNKLARL